MRHLRTCVVVAVAVLAGLVAFLVTVHAQGAAARAQRRPLGRWLGLTDQQAADVEKADPDFTADSEKLTSELSERRLALAALLEDPNATADQITVKAESVIEAQDALTRRVMRHVLALRPILTVAQQKQLMGVCATGVRDAAHWCWRGSRGDGEAPGHHGPPWQQQGGKGRGYRGGR